MIVAVRFILNLGFNVLVSLKIDRTSDLGMIKLFLKNILEGNKPI